MSDRSHRSHPSIGLVSTYPPERCGIATFTKSLVHSIAEGRRSWDSLGIACVTSSPRPTPDEVVVSFDPASPTALDVAAEQLNQYDVVLIQHEFGIFGPDDGVAVLDLVQRLERPYMVTFHTVVSDPSPRQNDIVAGLLDGAQAAVVMSTAARRRLYAQHPDLAQITVIPHGAHPPAPTPELRTERPLILSWGLLGPGKGLEWGVRAVAQLGDVRPLPLYVIAGQTHPNVLKREGEAYRKSVQQLVKKLRAEDMVMFVDEYLTLPALGRLLASADTVLLPYDSKDQVTSGALVEALAAGVPVVATAFPHAVELLAGGAGVVVRHQRPTEMAGAIRRLLVEPNAYLEAARAARRAGDRLLWSRVTARYEDVLARVAAGVKVA